MVGFDPRGVADALGAAGNGRREIGAFFARGHDKIAEAALTAAEFGGAVPQLLHKFGYGPGRPVIDEAVEAGTWIACDHCWYKGTPSSVATHRRKFHSLSDSGW